VAERLTRTLRLIHIRDLFVAGWQGSTEELAEACAVSRRTVQRDLANLCAEPFYLPLMVEESWRLMPREGGHRNL